MLQEAVATLRKLSERRDARCMSHFWLSVLPQVRIFRFDGRHLETIPCVDIEHISAEHDLPDISLPFPVCLFECSDNNPLVQVNGANIKAVLSAEVAPGDLMTLCFASESDKQLMTSLNARSFHNYQFSLSPEGQMKLNIEDELMEWMGHLSKVVVNPILSRLQNGRVFQSNEQERFRLRGEHKGVYKVKNIIYVGRRTEQTHYTPSGLALEYSHRFEVRGHWRKVNPETIGKNRAGQRVVKGYTWVSEFTKGDAELPLVKKIRTIKIEEMEQNGPGVHQ